MVVGVVLSNSVLPLQAPVTAVQEDERGFFMQIPDTADEYTGPDYSGTYVYLGNASDGISIPSVGDRVKASGSAVNFYDQLQLGSLTALEILERTPM